MSERAIHVRQRLEAHEKRIIDILAKKGPMSASRLVCETVMVIANSRDYMTCRTAERRHGSDISRALRILMEKGVVGANKNLDIELVNAKVP